MGDLPRAARIIEACKKRLSIPLTVKFRLGLGKGETPVNYLELGRICEDLDVAAVCLHARTAKQMYTGRADWSEIRRLKESLSIPVIGNGDVAEPADALRMVAETGCDGVMAGRGVLKDPWLFRRTAAVLRGEAAPEISAAEHCDLMLTHFRWIMEAEEPKLALHKMRTFAGRYTKGLANARRLREKIGRTEEPDAFLEVVREHFAERGPEQPASHTERTNG